MNTCVCHLSHFCLSHVFCMISEVILTIPVFHNSCYCTGIMYIRNSSDATCNHNVNQGNQCYRPMFGCNDYTTRAVIRNEVFECNHSNKNYIIQWFSGVAIPPRILAGQTFYSPESIQRTVQSMCGHCIFCNCGPSVIDLMTCALRENT